MNVLGITDERRKVAAAIAASVVLHFCVVSLFAWLNKFPVSVPRAAQINPEPVRIKIIEPLPSLLESKPRPAFVDAPSRPSTEKPPPGTITQSDADSVAASITQGTGSKDAPKLDGKNTVTLAMENRDLRFEPGRPQPAPASSAALAQRVAPPEIARLTLEKRPQRELRPSPSPRPQASGDAGREVAFKELPRRATVVPESNKVPLVTDVPEKLVALDPSAIPVAQPPPRASGAEPPLVERTPSPAPDLVEIESAVTRGGGGVQQQTQLSKIDGGAARRGDAAFNAVGTPLGKYRKLMAQAIGARWQMYVARQMDLVTLGTVRIRFDILEDGTVDNIEVLSNDANSTLATLSIQAIMETKLPPIPPDLASALRDSRLEIVYSFHLWPPR